MNAVKKVTIDWLHNQPVKKKKFESILKRELNKRSEQILKLQAESMFLRILNGQ